MNFLMPSIFRRSKPAAADEKAAAEKAAAYDADE